MGSMIMEYYSNKLVTPCFLIHAKKFKDNYNIFMSSFGNLWAGKVNCGYSVKTNNNAIMLNLALKNGLYAEVVSESEYIKAKQCGFRDTEIIYNGPLKGETVLEACLMGAKVNIDNFKELDVLINKLDNKCKENVHLGLRVNFDLEREVPGETSTGGQPGRFGFCYENGDLMQAILKLKESNIPLEGLHVHYTTKTRSLKVFGAIAQKISEICMSYQLRLQYIDIGGGFWGGRYIEGKPTIEQYAVTITNCLKESGNLKAELIMEPGAAISATAVDYITTVDSVKNIRESRVITVDGSFLHINPFMIKRSPTYILPISGKKIIPIQEICGATCLENDRFLQLCDMGELTEGDKIIFTNAGAYTMSFVSDFILKKPNVYLCDN